MPKRSKSSARWLDRQKRDYFVRQAQDNGQVSRAHYKLLQLDQRFKLIKPQSKVLELGAAPGGWTNYLESRLSKGLLIAVDPLPITAGLETQVIEGLVGDDAVNEKIVEILVVAGGGEVGVQNDVFIFVACSDLLGISDYKRHPQ